MTEMWMPEVPDSEDGTYTREDMCRYAAEVVTKWDRTPGSDGARWRYVRECIRHWGNIPGGITQPAGGAQKCSPAEIDAACDLSMKLCPVDGTPDPNDLLREAAEALDDASEYMRHHSYSPSFMREAEALARALRRRIGEKP